MGKSAGRGWPGGGGQALPPSFAEDFDTIIQHALLPLNEVRRMYRLTSLPPASPVEKL